MDKTFNYRKANRDYLPSGIALILIFLSVFFIENGVLRDTHGVFMYPLDDPFIHMQVARNFAFYGEWGINSFEFSSASSSLLYTLLLAAIFKIFSVHVIVPFVINCVTTIFLIVLVDDWLVKQKLNRIMRTIILVTMVILVPLPTLIVSGMEHTLQCLFFFLFLSEFSSWMQQAKAGVIKSKIPIRVILFAMLLVMTRYEGLFVVAIACLFLWFNRRIKESFILGSLALLPIGIFGVYSITRGSYFLPNSVLVKSEGAPFSLSGLINFFENIFVNKLTTGKTASAPGVFPPGISLLVAQRILIILPIVFLLFRQRLKSNYEYTLILLVLLGTAIMHIALASTGWFYRYEAYLVLCTIVFVGTICYQFRGDLLIQRKSLAFLVTAILLFALFFPFLLRSGAAFSKARQACVNIYQQQYQMAGFLEKYYSNDVIAANDIGAISYRTNANIVDLWGLGSIDVARSRKEHYWTDQFLDTLVIKKQVKVAVVYDEWFNPVLLKNWKKVATWQITNNVICGSDIVSFYAVKKEETETLSKNLQTYQSELPKGIEVVYY